MGGGTSERRMRALLLRLDAPMMSFGGVIVDQNGYSDPFPGKSMLTGLFANALGFDRSEAERHQDLQGRLDHATRCDRPPERMIDYHTVDLGQAHLRDKSWTTRGAPDERAGGIAARRGTHIRYRHFLCDAVYTVAVDLRGDSAPDLEGLHEALCRPQRPLAIGRKPCVPSGPLSLGIREGNDLPSILETEPLYRPRKTDSVRGWWSAHPGAREGERVLEVCDERDWLNQIHVGRRRVVEGALALRGPR